MGLRLFADVKWEQRPPSAFVDACLRHPGCRWRAYMTAEVFVDIGYIAVVECILGGRVG